MKVTVLRTFPYAEDGHRVLQLPLGEAEVRDELVPGLVAEGWVADRAADHPVDEPKPPRARKAAR